MRFRLRRPRDLALALREVARRRPAEAEEYLETHQEEWGSLAEADPHNAADILEALEEDAALGLVADLGADQAADVLAEMRDDAAAGLVAGLDPSQAAAIVSELSPDDAADVLAELEGEARQAILELTPDDTAQELDELLAYPPESAGGFMTTEYASLQIGLTAGEAIEALRRMSEELDHLTYVHIVDMNDRLHGVLSFRDLVFARPGVGIEEVMVESPVAVRPEVDREEVAELIQRYNLLSLPVVDHRGHLLGIVTIDDVLEAIQEEAGEDLATMVGAGAAETIYSPVRTSIKNRLPWILVNLGIAFIVAGVVSRFEPLISSTAVLAAYMPVVASVGGNGGAQSLAIVIRAMAIEDLPPAITTRIIRRELIIALTNGLVVAVAAAVIAGSFTGSGRIALVIGLAVLGNMTVAGMAGAGIPLALQRLGQDPALASNIFLTLVSDLIGFGGFLAIAALLL